MMSHAPPGSIGATQVPEDLRAAPCRFVPSQLRERRSRCSNMFGHQDGRAQQTTRGVKLRAPTEEADLAEEPIGVRWGRSLRAASGRTPVVCPQLTCAAFAPDDKVMGAAIVEFGRHGRHWQPA